MRKIIGTVTLAFAIAVLVPASAEASSNRNSSPGCVSKKEFNKLRRNMTVSQVTRLFGTPGRQVYKRDRGFYDGEYVEEIDPDNTFFHEPHQAGDPYHYDEFGNQVPGEAYTEYYDETTGEWVQVFDPDNTYYYEDDSEGEPYHYDEYGDEVPGYAYTEYYDEYGGDYNSRVDVVRSYKKCKSFNRGRGRVGINFDDYSGWDTRLRAYSARKNVNDYFYRQGARLGK